MPVTDRCEILASVQQMAKFLLTQIWRGHLCRTGEFWISIFCITRLKLPYTVRKMIASINLLLNVFLFLSNFGHSTIKRQKVVIVCFVKNVIWKKVLPLIAVWWYTLDYITKSVLMYSEGSVCGISNLYWKIQDVCFCERY